MDSTELAAGEFPIIPERRLGKNSIIAVPKMPIMEKITSAARYMIAAADISSLSLFTEIVKDNATGSPVVANTHTNEKIS